MIDLSNSSPSSAQSTTPSAKGKGFFWSDWSTQKIVVGIVAAALRAPRPEEGRMPTLLAAPAGQPLAELRARRPLPAGVWAAAAVAALVDRAVPPATVRHVPLLEWRPIPTLGGGPIADLSARTIRALLQTPSTLATPRIDQARPAIIRRRLALER